MTVINLFVEQLVPDSISQILSGISEQTSFTIRRLPTAVSELPEPDDPLAIKISEIVKLVEDGSLRAAARAYERLWNTESSAASPKNRYRLKANIGQILLLMGERLRAVQAFRDAVVQDPTSTSAQGTLSLVLLLEGSTAEAFHLARKVLADDPQARQAVGVLIDAAPNTWTSAEIAEIIPEGLHTRLETLLGLSMRAAQDQDGECAEKYAHEAVERFPDDWRALAALGIANIVPLSKDLGARFTRVVPHNLMPNLYEATRLLRQAWSLLVKREDIVRGIYVAANLISTLDVAGHREESDSVLQAALQAAPTDPLILREHIRHLAAAGDWSEVLAAVDRIPDAEITLPDKVVRLQALILSGDPEQALEDARGFEFGDDADERAKEMVGTARLEAAAKLGRFEEEVAPVLDAYPNSVIVRSTVATLLPRDDDRLALITRDIERLAAATRDPRDRLFAADAFYSLGSFSAAANLYEGLHGVEQHYEALHRRLTALYFADRRADSRNLFESLHTQVKELPEYARVGVAIYERSGLLVAARLALEGLFLKDDSLQYRLQWIGILDRLGDNQSALEWLKTISPDAQGEPEILMSLALALDRYVGHNVVSLRLAYRALRGGYDNPKVHLQYAFGLFIQGGIKPEALGTPSVVSADTVVKLQDLSSAEVLERIIETEQNPVNERGEISVSHPLSEQLLGRAVGDSIELPKPGITRSFKIVEITNKYLFAHLRTLRTFEQSFPDNTAFATMNVDISQGAESLTPILDSAKARFEFSNFLMETYKQNPLPIPLFARLAGITPLAAWGAIYGHANAQFKCALGTAQEFIKVNEVLANKRRAIIDPVTLYGLIQLRVAETVVKAFDEVCIVQTTLDLLRQNVDEQKSRRGGRSGSIGWNGNSFTRFEFTDECVEELIDRAEEALQFSLTLSLVPAESDQELSKAIRDFFEGLHPSTLDTIRAAQGHSLLFLSDDLAMRVIAEESGTSVAWTQPAAWFAASRQLIAQSDGFEISAVLTEAKYWFTSLGSQDFLWELSRSSWRVTPRLGTFIEHIARPTNDRESTSKVLSQIMFLGWQAAPSPEAYSDFWSLLMKKLQEGSSSAAAIGLVQESFARVEAWMFKISQEKAYKKMLMSTTTNTTPSDIILLVNETIGKILLGIANALSVSAASLAD